MTILTSDGVSHGAPERNGRGSAFRLETACGLEFQSWLYASKRYGSRDLGKGLPVIVADGVIDCMTCLVRRAS